MTKQHSYYLSCSRIWYASTLYNALLFVLLRKIRRIIYFNRIQHTF
ncbi:hypothetical protein TrispH2_012027 [Trichoplax sp. H2]|nr:hypothetical protein TrispH2_012027 [Trichoplax sp. H2]|eukprot:RDD35853.1 hypothetical protein TrispH2_012027 [Trichoplax sp. H2]